MTKAVTIFIVALILIALILSFAAPGMHTTATQAAESGENAGVGAILIFVGALFGGSRSVK